MITRALLGRELLVALTSSDDKKAQVSAALARKSTSSISDALGTKLDTLWDTANVEALSFLTLVLRNNPRKTKADILVRPDVQAALRHPYEVAAQASEDLIRAAWGTSETDSVVRVKSELKLLGSAWKGYETDEALLDALVGDLHKNAQAMRSRFSEALNGDPKGTGKRLTVVAQDGMRRARYSGQQAVWGVATQVRDSAFAKAGLNKMWLALKDDPACCSHCRGLHKHVVGPGEQFPVSAGLKAYQGKLLGPPRHPNCRCVVVATHAPKS